MASVNKVILVGNLGRSPEVRYSPDGTAICNISIATTTYRKERNTGNRLEDTEWHRVVLYNRLAEIAGEYLKKGRSVYIEGRLKTRKWQDKNTGADRFSTEIIADQMQMLAGGSDSGPAESAPPTRQPSRQIPGAPAALPQSPAATGGSADLDDDIPFAPHLARRAAYCI